MIELRGVTVRYGDRDVLRGLDLTFARGETTALLGRSGSGKTTILRLCNRLLLPSEGEVIVEGTSTATWDPIRLRRRTGYVIQEGGLMPHYTVARNAGTVCELEGWERARRDRRVAELLDFVGLPHGEFAGRYPHELSGGQRQRVGVARALAADPPVLLCDEPFGALDPITRAELQREFVRMTAELDTTIVFVTHDVREALLVGDRVVLLAGGAVAVDARADVFGATDHPEARAFLEAAEIPR